MIILGIDPGVAITGYGIICHEGNRFRVIEYGAVLTSPELSLSQRLCKINNDIGEIIKRLKPEVMAIEELFFNKNIKTALTVGHGRGVAMLAGATEGLQVYEYTPLQVKQAVVGYGRAEKSQVQQMVKTLLALSQIPKPDDVADSLAVAICHAHSVTLLDKFK
ncbi:MAG TPA: crossover junction endodeoxyribonuclease RuvC [Clostridiales bacterium]|nr:crossover junction endodeoxyribonuclease RuvC [Clostridiales bacterium]